MGPETDLAGYRRWSPVNGRLISNLELCGCAADRRAELFHRVRTRGGTKALRLPLSFGLYNPRRNDMRKDAARSAAIALIAKCCGLDSLTVENALATFQSSDNPAYCVIRQKKKSGKYRIIHAPCEELKIVQTGLLAYFYRFPTCNRMFGFQPRQTPLDNALVHFKIPFIHYHNPDICMRKMHLPRWILTIDLKDAFPSVKADLVEEMYFRLFDRSKLQGHKGWPEEDALSVYREFINLLVRLTTYRRRLPQGAPTSPYMLNLALCHTGIVERIKTLCSEPAKPLQYSIYADDITISSYKAKISDTFIKKLIEAVEEGGIFRVNRDKTNRNSAKYKAHKITGVVLTYDRNGKARLTLPQKTLKTWRGRIHSLRRRLKESGPEALAASELDQVQGNIAWIKTVYRGSVIPSSVRKEIELFDRAMRKMKYEKKERYYQELRDLQNFLLLLAERWGGQLPGN